MRKVRTAGRISWHAQVSGPSPCCAAAISEKTGPKRHGRHMAVSLFWLLAPQRQSWVGKAGMMQFALTLLAGVLALFVLERALTVVMRWLAPILPDEVAGYDGWLIDTRTGKGIFDRRSA
jgi:hypothetical protein